MGTNLQKSICLLALICWYIGLDAQEISGEAFCQIQSKEFNVIENLLTDTLIPNRFEKAKEPMI